MAAFIARGAAPDTAGGDRRQRHARQPACHHRHADGSRSQGARSGMRGPTIVIVGTVVRLREKTGLALASTGRHRIEQNKA